MPAFAGRTRGLGQELTARISAEDPISVHDYMAACNAHYYATRDPLGAAGDFTTAPEISQMFGEIVGAWLADLWLRAGCPEVAYVELGPGRGTLARDALRVLAKAGCHPDVHFVETSPVLRAAQARAVAHAEWHEDLETLPGRPLLLVANEFFDALPVRQFVRGAGGWRERMLGAGLVPEAGPEIIADVVPKGFEAAPSNAVFETNPAAAAMMARLARRLSGQGGAALVVDYGHARSALGETLQAVRRHGYADPFADPGEADLTAQVDFEALGAAAGNGVRLWGPLRQGAWLRALGFDARAAALAAATPGEADTVYSAASRLADEDQMGALFKVLAVTAPAWPDPAGFVA